MPRKVIVIGWDGATFDVIKPLVKQGKMPNIKRMLDGGTHGLLASIIPPNSAPAWSSFSTGMNPGKHGVYYFTERVPGSYRFRFTHSITRTGKPIWMVVGDNKGKVGVMNVPGTFPPDKVNGFMFSGLDTPSPDCTYTWPEDLPQELKTHVAAYIIESEEARSIGFKNDTERAQFINAVINCAHNRWLCAKYLMEKYKPDLFILVFTTTDRIQHRFWKYMDQTHPHYDNRESRMFKNAIFDVYIELDRSLGEVLDKMDKDTVLFLMSDHGMGQRSVKNIYLNRWLLSKGYLKINTEQGFRKGVKGICFRGIKRVLNFIKQRMSLNQRRLARRFFYRVMHKGTLFLEIKNIDWQNTRAYSNELMNAIWINLKGREPMGIVEPGEEYSALCDEIIEELNAIKDKDTGGSIVKRVYKRDDIYHGSEIEKAPDLVIEWNNYNPQVSSLFSNDEANQFLSELTPEETSRGAMAQNSGDHKPDGILVAYGSGIGKGNTIENASILDMAPTILYALDQEIPREMDGRVLKGLFTRAFIDTHKEKYSKVDTTDSYKPRQVDIKPEDEEELKERLKSLGYI